MFSMYRHDLLSSHKISQPHKKRKTETFVGIPMCSLLPTEKQQPQTQKMPKTNDGKRPRYKPYFDKIFTFAQSYGVKVVGWLVLAGGITINKINRYM